MNNRLTKFSRLGVAAFVVLSSTAAQAAVRPTASLPAVAVSVAAVAQEQQKDENGNPCVAGVQGCVLPLGESNPVAAVPPAPGPYIAPPATAGGGFLIPLLAAVAALLGAGVAFDLFGGDDEPGESPG